MKLKMINQNEKSASTENTAELEKGKSIIHAYCKHEKD